MGTALTNIQNPYKAAFVVIALTTFGYFLLFRIMRLATAGFYIEAVFETMILVSLAASVGGVVWECIAFQIAKRK
jgi:hypothetical protein